MRKNHKKALGLLGLSAVIGMTAVAASLPTPVGATASVSDTISITVLDGLPITAIVNIADGDIVVKSDMTATFDYGNLQTLDIYLQRVEPMARSAFGTQIAHFDFDFDHRTGTTSPVNLDLDNHGGYGQYILTAEGYGWGSYATASAKITYSPVTIEGLGTDTDQDGNIIGDKIPTDETTGNPVVDVNVPGGEGGAIVDVYDKDGNKVIDGYKTDGGPTELPFTDNKLPSGDYTIVITAVDKNGNPVGSPIRVSYKYTALAVPEVPKTGNFLAQLNISRADYLTTGLVVFGIATLGAGAIFLKKKNSRR